MKKLLLPILLGLVLLAVPAAVFAANIANATYSGLVRITNNGTAETNVFAAFTLNTANFISQSLLNSSVNNSAIYAETGEEATYMPGASDNNSWIVFVPSISGPNINLEYTLYTGGNTSMSSKQAIFNTNAGMATSDNDTSLELSNDFRFEQQGYFDTSAGGNKNLVYKEDAFKLFVSSSGNITARIMSAGDTEVLSLTTTVSSGNHTIEVRMVPQ